MNTCPAPETATDPMHFSRDAAAALSERAQNLVTLTGEHGWDEFLARRTAAMNVH
ncbi:hypothetical protein [Mycobacterium sp. HM-7]